MKPLLDPLTKSISTIMSASFLFTMILIILWLIIPDMSFSEVKFHIFGSSGMFVCSFALFTYRYNKCINNQETMMKKRLHDLSL